MVKVKFHWTIFKTVDYCGCQMNKQKTKAPTTSNSFLISQRQKFTSKFRNNKERIQFFD
jgi:hypothetical protein